ncbi:Hypothetical protein SCLAV_5503 [Streptomyces clavuligerus]|uniref:Uncharacterized protein n=1 Tax=Streptomyces clavuligerus TaxID=1901 RepID=E2Q1E4_STRCL|nr:Hypothetical protein SCLAV_5503 [Streptomyces clavuligerus]
MARPTRRPRTEAGDGAPGGPARRRCRSGPAGRGRPRPRRLRRPAGGAGVQPGEEPPLPFGPGGPVDRRAGRGGRPRWRTISPCPFRSRYSGLLGSVLSNSRSPSRPSRISRRASTGTANVRSRLRVIRTGAPFRPGPGSTRATPPVPVTTAVSPVTSGTRAAVLPRPGTGRPVRYRAGAAATHPVSPVSPVSGATATGAGAPALRLFLHHTSPG